MSSYIQPVINSFLGRKSKTISNTSTDGENLYLFGNCIAHFKQRDPDILTISSGGYRLSLTTKDRLNMLPDIHIKQIKGIWYIYQGVSREKVNDEKFREEFRMSSNWKQWDGSPIDIFLE